MNAVSPVSTESGPCHVSLPTPAQPVFDDPSMRAKADAADAGSIAATPSSRALAWRARWQVWKPYLIAVAVAILALASFVAIDRLIAEVRYDDVTAAIRAASLGAILPALLSTALSYAALIGYDFTGLRYVGARVPMKITAFASFCAYALGNTIGLGPLTGGAVRYRVYGAAGVEPANIARLILFITVGFGSGIAFVGALGLVLEGPHVAALVGAPGWALQGAGAALLALLIGTVVLIARRPAQGRLARIPWPTPTIAVSQLLFSLLDITAAAGALWFLLPEGAISFPALLAVYAVAIALGIASHVPGGLGVFEAVILLAIGQNAPLEQVTAALVLYRAIYYIVPLLLAVAILGVFEGRRLLGRSLSVAGNVMVQAADRLTPTFLAALTFFSGGMLLLSGSLPASGTSIELLRASVPLPIVEASHFLASISGLALLFIARGLLHRLDAAWFASVLLTVTNLVLAWSKGVAVVEMSVLLLLLMLLGATRSAFTRRASLFDHLLSRGWLVAVAVMIAGTVWILFFAHREVAYSHQLWWQFEFDSEAPRGLRAALAVSLIGMGAALWSLMRPSAGEPTLPSPEQLARAEDILRRQPYADANLAMMRDKSLLFSDSGQSFIMYGRHGRTWVALFDPVGLRSEWQELIWRFVEMANAHGCRPVFYEVRAETLPYYLDAGMRAYKLGEEAKVDLAGFDLKGGARAGLRNTKSRAEKEGLTVEILPPEKTAESLPLLREISDAWLADHRVREKRFSLGAFEEEYIRRFATALVRKDGKPVAFATLMNTDLKQELTIDLMRHRSEAPRFTMEYLFTWLILWAREQGYESFVLGMAPLSGLERHRLAPLWHRVGRLVWRHGNMFYNFQGLRGFKDKFKPRWESRYLAAPGGLNPVLAITDIAALTSGGLKGIVAK
jgi:phosphatidylglycerol lysyltransferase